MKYDPIPELKQPSKAPKAGRLLMILTTLGAAAIIIMVYVLIARWLV